MSSLLKKEFTSKDNFAFLLETVQYELTKIGYKSLSRVDDDFIQVVNTIASSVFKHEFSRNSSKKLEEGLYTINNIIIKEAVQYIISKFPEKEENHDEEIIIKTEEENFKIYLENEELSFSPSPLYNVTKITIEGLYSYNEEYFINGTNDEISFTEGNSETIYVKIDHGNYTKEALALELQDLLRENSPSKHLYTCFVDLYSEKIIISSSKIDNSKNNAPFSKRQIKNNLLALEKAKKSSNNYEDGVFSFHQSDNSLPKTLGFKNLEILKGKHFYEGDNPIKLIKIDKLHVNLDIYTDEKETPEVLKERVFLEQKKAEQNFYKMNYMKTFSTPVNINRFVLNFDQYNHRGFPYTLVLSIHQQNLS